MNLQMYMCEYRTVINFFLSCYIKKYFDSKIFWLVVKMATNILRLAKTLHYYYNYCTCTVIINVYIISIILTDHCIQRGGVCCE